MTAEGGDVHDRAPKRRHGQDANVPADGKEAVTDTSLLLQPESQRLVTSWETPSVDISQIRSELASLWSEWTLRYGDRSGHGLGDSREQVYMRPSTVNVIAVTNTERDAQRTAEILGSLTDYSPSRSVVLARNAQHGEHAFAVQVAVDERVLHPSSSPARIEVITITAAPGNDEALASIASTLLGPDLPDVLYVPGEPFGDNPLVMQLLERTDGLLVDTVTASDVGATLEFLRSAAMIKNALGLGDLVWTRLRTWRDLIAQFYDQPAALASLEHINEVTITYARRRADGRSGLTAGLLIGGWLASRLGWRTPGELIPAGDAFRLTLRAGGRGRSREILLHLREGSSDVSCSSLEKVTLTSTDPHPSVFSVERVGETAITTFSSTPQMPDMSRLVHASCPSDRVVLAAKLRRLRIDPVYREALEFAASLWPEGFAP